MKVKVTFILLLLSLIPINGFALEKQSVTFSDCVDGDTAEIILNNEKVKVRFLAIDTPETKHPTKGEEPFGKEASSYTCDRLKKANKVEIELDSNSDEKDKYDRYLVWIFVDGSLLQDELISKGYAKVAYLYDDYKYTSELQESEKYAKEEKLGIWSEYEEETLSNKDIIIIIVIIVIFLLIFCFNKSYRKKTINKFKNKTKKYIKNEFNKLLK